MTTKKNPKSRRAREHTKPASKKPAYPGSFLAPEAMGGIIAGDGFDFQTRYAACGIPLWLLEATFQQLLYEGAGDIDIRYQEGGKSSRTFMQVKDHDVQPAELKEVIEQFIDRDTERPEHL